MNTPVKPDWLAVMLRVPGPITFVPGPPPVIVLARLITASDATALKFVLLPVVMPPASVRVAPGPAPKVAPTPVPWVMAPEKVLTPLNAERTPFPSGPLAPLATVRLSALATVTPPVSSMATEPAPAVVSALVPRAVA